MHVSIFYLNTVALHVIDFMYTVNAAICFVYQSVFYFILLVSLSFVVRLMQVNGLTSSTSIGLQAINYKVKPTEFI